MKYIYIAGLEHSGTTLLSQMLANLDGALALGEVGQFLSPTHMETYMARWGEYPDVKRCSCGQDWEKCEFWKDHLDIYGLATNIKFDLRSRYIELLTRLSEKHPNAVVIDASKTTENLETMVGAFQETGLNLSNFVVLLVAKDPRAFAHSMNRKISKSMSLLSYFRTMNLWSGQHERLLKKLNLLNIPFSTLTYSALCKHPQTALRMTLQFTNQTTCDFSEIAHQNSHVAVGNKDFMERNRVEIREDTAWKSNWKARLAYLCNLKAQRIYKSILESASSDDNSQKA